MTADSLQLKPRYWKHVFYQLVKFATGGPGGNILVHCEHGYHRGPTGGALVWCALVNCRPGCIAPGNVSWFLDELARVRIK